MISSSAAKKHAEKLLKYIQDISGTCPYRNTQNDLVSIIGTCKEVIEDAVTILNRCEYPGLSSIEESMCHRSQDESNCSLNGQETSKSEEQIPSSVKRYEISNFEKILKDLSESNFSVVEACECSELLLLWYKKRFLNDAQKLSSFRYNISQIKGWVHSIVLAYGKSVNEDNRAEFVKRFKVWCNGLDDVSSKSSSYPLPYDVYEVHRSNKDSDMSPSALVLWEMLYDAGLNRTSEKKFKYILFGRDDIMSICKDVCARISYWHEDYRSCDEEWLSVCKLHRNIDRL